jgi:hypothetical protein
MQLEEAMVTIMKVDGAALSVDPLPAFAHVKANGSDLLEAALVFRILNLEGNVIIRPRRKRITLHDRNPNGRRDTLVC